MAQHPASADLTYYLLGSSTVLGIDGTPRSLVGGSTYYAEITVNEVSLYSVQWLWDASLIASITYDVSNFPDAVAYTADATHWTDSGVSALSIPGGSSSTNLAHFTNNAAARVRAKIVVSTTGTLRGRQHAKAVT